MTKSSCPLVLVEWEDSCVPTARWQHLSDFEMPAVHNCASVGWLLKSNESSFCISASMGAIDDEDQIQSLGIITIPRSAIKAIYSLAEKKRLKVSSF